MKKIDAKKFLIAALLIVGLYAAYATGQSRKPVENCCCKHNQQMAEDIHRIAEFMLKPSNAKVVIPPEIEVPEFEFGPPIKAKPLKVPKSF